MWIETYALTQELTASEGPDMKLWEEEEILNKGPYEFNWGSFYIQEERPKRNPLAILFMILGGILGLWMGCQEEQGDYLFEFIWSVPLRFLL